MLSSMPLGSLKFSKLEKNIEKFSRKHQRIPYIHFEGFLKVDRFYCAHLMNFLGEETAFTPDGRFSG